MKIKIAVLVAALACSFPVAAVDNYVCSVMKFKADFGDDKGPLVAPKATIIKIDQKTIRLDKHTFQITEARKVGINLQVIAGYDYFNKRRIYKIVNSDGEDVFVTQTFDIPSQTAETKDQVMYASCILLKGVNIDG